jgi:hypothetical protein
MKKIATTLIFGIGLLLLGLNYGSNHQDGKKKTDAKMKRTEIALNDQANDKSFEVSRNIIPSIFSALLGLIK